MNRTIFVLMLANFFLSGANFMSFIMRAAYDPNRSMWVNLAVAILCGLIAVMNAVTFSKLIPRKQTRNA